MYVYVGKNPFKQSTSDAAMMLTGREDIVNKPERFFLALYVDALRSHQKQKKASTKCLSELQIAQFHSRRDLKSRSTITYRQIVRKNSSPEVKLDPAEKFLANFG